MRTWNDFRTSLFVPNMQIIGNKHSDTPHTPSNYYYSIKGRMRQSIDFYSHDSACVSVFCLAININMNGVLSTECEQRRRQVANEHPLWSCRTSGIPSFGARRVIGAANKSDATLCRSGGADRMTGAMASIEHTIAFDLISSQTASARYATSAAPRIWASHPECTRTRTLMSNRVVGMHT